MFEGSNIYEHILNGMDNAVMVIDFEGSILIYNQAAERILGFSAVSVIGQCYRDIFFQSDGNDAFNDTLIDIIVTRSELFKTEATFIKHTGENVPLSITGTLLQDGQGTTYGVLLVMTDLTEARRRQFIREAFGRYVAQPVADLVESHPESILLEPEEREATILFADIRGFTEMSEKMLPQELLGVLREYLAVMVTATTEYGGTVDKFIGDAIMSVYNAPLALVNHAEMAVRTGLEIQRKVTHLNRAIFKNIRVGVGICTGKVVVGNVGSEQRMEYTAIGDTVNIASRLEGLSKRYDAGIIVSQSTYEQVSELVTGRTLGRVHVRGKTQAVRIYAVESIKR